MEEENGIQLHIVPKTIRDIGTLWHFSPTLSCSYSDTLLSISQITISTKRVLGIRVAHSKRVLGKNTAQVCQFLRVTCCVQLIYYFRAIFTFRGLFFACCLLDTAGFQPLTQENTSVRYCAFLAYIYYIEYCMNSRRQINIKRATKVSAFVFH